MFTVYDRVNMGIVYLDNHRPGWLDKINVETLDMNYSLCCVLGQIDGDFNNSNIVWNLTRKEVATLGLRPKSQKPNSSDFKGECACLTKVWKQAITSLKDSQASINAYNLFRESFNAPPEV